MITLIVIFGGLIFLAGLTILLDPARVFGPLKRHAHRVELHVIAVGLRLVLGGLLIACADGSRYPVVITVLGWLSVFAAAVLLFMGRARFLRLMDWAFGLAGRFGRVGGLLAMAFGGFLVHAFL